MFRKNMSFFQFLNPINSYKYSVFNKMKFVFQEMHKDPKASSTFENLQEISTWLPLLAFSILHFSTVFAVIRSLVLFHLHLLYFVFVSSDFDFLFQSFWNLYNIGC